QSTSQRLVLTTTTAINPSIISHAAPTTTNARENVAERTEMSSQPNSTLPRSTDGTTLSSSATTVSKDGINNSATTFNRTPVSLATFTTVGDLSQLTRSAAATSTSTKKSSNSIVTYSTPSAVVHPSDNSSMHATTLFPTSIALTSPPVKEDSTTTNFSPTLQTTELNHNFSNPSTALPDSKDVNEDKTNKGGVIAGVIVGAILLSTLIGLMIGYFICGKKRSESFSHRRLYDDTRNDPVLHLDNSFGPYDTSFVCVPDDRSSTADKAVEDNTGCPSDGIPMADMTPSHLSL
ncbi:MUC15 protein, partial [Eolophus roseicapillus]|nr:MUC15 protein [Eolophus roseicapilla]